MSAKATSGSEDSVRTANLTVVFVAMDDFAERMARLSYQDQAALAAVFEELTVPVARKYGGGKVKTIQESQLFTFPSPTAALKAAAAMQDRTGRYCGAAGDDLAVRLRIGAASGEVRVFGGDVYGEPVNLAARVKALAGLGEVLLTGGVQLSMNRAEIATEPVGKKTFKGIPEPVDVHRLSCSAGSEDTFAGVTLDALDLPALDADDAHALASGKLAWRLYRLRRAVAGGRGGRRTDGERAPRLTRDRVTGTLATLLKQSLSVARAGSELARRHIRMLGAALACLLLVAALVTVGRAVSDRTAAPPSPEEAAVMLPELEQRVADRPDDAAARAALAHALAHAGRSEAAIESYLRAANQDAGALAPAHIEDLVRLLPAHGESTGHVERALTLVGRPAIRPLRRVFDDENARTYHRRRAGQVLVALGREVDLIPLWMETLGSSECAARELAARELARLGDTRAVPALRQAASEGCLRGRNAARRALATLE